MSITKYALIDHVGALTSGENKRIYKRVFAQAKADDLTAYTMRKACLMDSPFAREVTDAMKYRIRQVKNPTKVYLICNELDAKAEFISNMWESRGISVEIYEVNGFATTHKLDLGETPDRKRKIAETWAQAIGWSFSAPVTRVQREIVPDNFCQRPDHADMVARGETHFTKPFTSAEQFLEMNHCIATDAEIDAFYQHIMYLWNTKVDGERLLDSSLEPDFKICTCCGRPRNIRNHKDQFGKIHLNSICPHCEAEFDDEGQELETYFEDSFSFDEE